MFSAAVTCSPKRPITPRPICKSSPYFCRSVVQRMGPTSVLAQAPFIVFGLRDVAREIAGLYLWLITNLVWTAVSAAAAQPT